MNKLKKLNLRLLKAWAKGKMNKGNKIRQKLIRYAATHH